MSSEGFSRFLSPDSVVGSDGFVPKSIVPTVRLEIMMLVEMQIKILNGEEILVNWSKLRT